jgi:hypothetical protein
MHLQSGAIMNHHKRFHMSDNPELSTPLTRDLLVNNTRVLHRINDSNRLSIVEALIIKNRNPNINKQNTGICRTLFLFQNSSI